VAETRLVEAGSNAPGPSEMLMIMVNGSAVAIANIDGALHAFDDTCTHRECPLSDGVLDGQTVVCPCHRSKFDLLTGAPLNGPATVPIRIRAVRQDGDKLLIEP